MEDAHATILDLDNPDDSAAAQSGAGKKGKHSFFAVFDGHGGSTVAKYSGETVHHRLRQTDQYQKKDYSASLKRAFLKTDEDLRANPDYAHDTSGCTAVAALILENNTIIVANAGDSRSVLSVGGEVKPMSYDHKPVNKGENARIVAAGGFVEFGRVNGNLALSRALGDFEFKQNQSLEAERQIVTADPDVIEHTSTGEEEFLVIACDGIWDVLKNQEVVDFTRRCIANGKELQEIAELALDKCLAPDSDWGGVGCDNMTFMVIALLGNRTKQEWYEWVKSRVNSGQGYQTPKDLPEPFANRSQGRPGIGGQLTGPAQMLSNAISNGTLRFDRGSNDDDDMDTDDSEQYHKSPSPISENNDHSGGSTSGSSSESPSVAADTPGTPSVDIDSSAAPEKLHAGSTSTGEGSHALSPPSAVMGVHGHAKSHADSTGNSKDAETPHSAVKADGLMDTSENPLSG